MKESDWSSDSIFEISCPIVFMNKPMGSVVLAINKSVLLQAQADIRTRIFIVFGIILILGTIASVLLASFIIKPIAELSIGVSELKEGTSKSPLKIYADDELGKLTINFNEMSSTIAEQQSKLNKYARDLEEAYVSIVRVVAAAIDAKDPYTHGHSARVAQNSPACRRGDRSVAGRPQRPGGGLSSSMMWGRSKRPTLSCRSRPDSLNPNMRR